MAQAQPGVGRTKEQMLREEVRFYADSIQKYLQWGLTVMVTLQTAIFFVRRDLASTYIDAGILQKGQELPYYRYLVGTAFLFLVAFILWRFTSRVTDQYRHYKNQLLKDGESGIDDQPTTGVTNWARYLYFSFPIYDLAVRVWVDLSLKISVH